MRLVLQGLLWVRAKHKSWNHKLKSGSQFKTVYSHKWTQPSQRVPTRPRIINTLCHELLNKSEKEKVAYATYQTGNQHVGADNVGDHPVALLVHCVEEEHPPEGMQQDEAEGQEGCRQEWSYLTLKSQAVNTLPPSGAVTTTISTIWLLLGLICFHAAATGLLLSKCVHGDACKS